MDAYLVLAGRIDVSVEIEREQLVVGFDTAIGAVEQVVGQVVLVHGVLEPAETGRQLERVLVDVLAIGRDEVGETRLELAVDVHLELAALHKRKLIVLGEVGDKIARLIGRQVPRVDNGLLDGVTVERIDATLDVHVELVALVDEAVDLVMEGVGGVRGRGGDRLEAAAAAQHARLEREKLAQAHAVHANVHHAAIGAARYHHVHLPVACSTILLHKMNTLDCRNRILTHKYVDFKCVFRQKVNLFCEYLSFSIIYYWFLLI